MKLLMIVLLCLPLVANACKDFEAVINKMVLLGELSVEFKPSGEVKEVECNAKKLGVKECEHIIEHVIEHYRKNKKG